MSHYAKIENGVVTAIIVAEQDFIDRFHPGEIWVQASYNTRGGMHLLGGVPLRKNYPGYGWVYDSVRDAFYEQRPFPSWVLNEDTCLWEPPTPMPQDGKDYVWDESVLSWAEVPPP